MSYKFLPSDNELHAINEKIKQMQSDSKKESKLNTKRFIIQTVISVLALISAVVAAVASIISL